MMDVGKLKEIVTLMSANDLSEVVFESETESLRIRRGPRPTPVVNHQPVIYQGGTMPAQPMMMAPPAMGFAAPAPIAQAVQSAGVAPPAASAAPAADPDAGLIAIESPMVGTCYLTPRPDDPAFVKVGQGVSNDTVVCLIEAMKVFNEIKAEKSGKIERVLVKNGQAVEFGQKLFLVRP
ncbi:MAG: acetyl-CoA carboxylase biotin carboxyl carrier protein [Planctomycetota bacterium]|nr:acetyl-CoA carboxylase biotin carboxyl carrier protein [Planctomycetota bacterium]